ncbi:ROK family protein [Aquibacillus koreensis]|uniref:fructokinase n=1 Tax=Aquibacillus koreensis TaxID=279446 RepID=A0A9X3WJ60_9BACI|nr:ROK family protein [Aquibacillus koreensis]MCT2537124.1 ROK family protein [Aquibacillus koreensis]MDC3419893.1 ROK family protein [Aquibacillus koreensis]
MYYGGIEAGGTKFVCAVGNEQVNIIEKVSIPTTTPTETLNQVFHFFEKYALKSIGIGSFGPIDLNEKSPTFGYLTTTPRKGWENFNLLGAFKERYTMPISLTTDVNAAAYGEYIRGYKGSIDSCLYLTVGTGIGGGFIKHGDIVQGYGHPEMGHILIQKHPKDHYPVCCAFHPNCLEGMASGSSMEERYNKKAYEFDRDSEVWELEAHYLAQAIVNYTLIVRPDKIILGGGVMKQEQLFPLIREEFKVLMGDFVETPFLEEYIVGPKLGDNAGIVGCLTLASELV